MLNIMGSTTGNLRIGTSGYSFEDWRGVFYPGELPKGKMLDFYAQHFDTVEVNSTYYRIPSRHVFYHMGQKTSDGFHFIVKVHAGVTHKRQGPADSIHALLEAVQPLEEAGKLQGFLAQFPYSYKNNPANRDYLKSVREMLGDHRFFVEFRHRSWLTEKVLNGLREFDMGYVSVDEPQLGLMMPPEVHVTNGVGYLRLHGRNADNWYDSNRGDRYDYLYTEQELRDWLPRIGQLVSHASLTYLFFNNCHVGHAVKNARMMKELLSRPADVPF
jgi:uncharacterized protein YecE (DUF72 family)